MSKNINIRKRRDGTQLSRFRAAMEKRRKTLLKIAKNQNGYPEVLLYKNIIINLYMINYFSFFNRTLISHIILLCGYLQIYARLTVKYSR